MTVAESMGRRYTTPLRWLLLLALAAPASPTRAEAPAPTERVEFSGDELEARRDEGWLALRGNVVVTHHDSRLEADAVEIRYAADGRTVDEIRARGNVRLTEPGRRGTADRARYVPASRRLELEGRPRVWEADDLLTGSRIVLTRNPDRLSVTDARAVVSPERVRGAIDTPAEMAPRPVTPAEEARP